MKFVTLFLGFCLCCFCSNGQQRMTDQRIVLSGEMPPLVWIDTMQTDLQHLVMDRSVIDSLSLKKDSVAAEGSSSKTLRDVIIISPKPPVKLIRWAALLERQGVPPADRKLRVCINKTLVKNPALLLIDPAFVKTIEITADRHWTYPGEANGTEMYLNILTYSK